METKLVESMVNKKKSLKNLGLKNIGQIYWNLSIPALYEEAIRRHEGMLSAGGPLCVTTYHTGRLPKDKFIVKEPSSENKIAWGKVNVPFEQKKFDALKRRVCNFLQDKDLFVHDCYAGADERYRIKIRVISERATHALFARTMFLEEAIPENLQSFVPDFTILHAPNFHADPAKDGTNSDAFILLHLGLKLILIGGTAYAGEIKKSIFTIMNYLLPEKGVLSMHCSANYGKDPNDAAIFFGLSGTGKTTLSAVPDRTLIGDDEHGWSDHGVFNIEGGCYAKVIRLSKEGEPEIYETTHKFGTLLENVIVKPKSRKIDLDDDSLTENTRGSYPVSFIPNMTLEGVAGHPKNIIMLTCDAFGVFPPVAKLTEAQAMYHFLSGYTSKLAGTELGIKEPQATFSACFGGPFMPLAPSVYARLLGEMIKKHKSDVWLINTGWTGGPYGVGARMSIPVTRAIIRAALDGTLKKVKMKKHPVFNVQVPLECPGVEASILDPRNTWKDPEAYDQNARKVAELFHKNFQEIAGDAAPEIAAAGPKVQSAAVAVVS